MAEIIGRQAFENGHKILQNVKIKGAKENSYLDKTMEQQLWSQIYPEAYSRATIEYIQNSAKQFHNTIAQDDSLLASPYHVLASCNQLQNYVLSRLCTSNKLIDDKNESFYSGWALQKGPFPYQEDSMNQEWIALIQDDCNHFLNQEAHRFSVPKVQYGKIPVYSVQQQISDNLKFTSLSSWCWLDVPNTENKSSPNTSNLSLSDQIDNEYPALAELLQRFQSLPYEFNKKVPKLGLLQPLPGMTLLQHYQLQVQYEPISQSDNNYNDISGEKIDNSLDSSDRVPTIPKTYIIKLDGSLPTIQRKLQKQYKNGNNSTEGSNDQENIGYKITTTFLPGLLQTTDTPVHTTPTNTSIPHDEIHNNGTALSIYTIPYNSNAQGYLSTNTTKDVQFCITLDGSTNDSSSSSFSTTSSQTQNNVDTIDLQHGNRLLFYRSRTLQSALTVHFSPESIQYLHNHLKRISASTSTSTCTTFHIFLINYFLHGRDDKGFS